MEVTNELVFEIIGDLLVEYMEAKGLVHSAEVLQQELQSTPLLNANGIFPSADVTKLEVLLSEPLMKQIAEATGSTVATQVKPESQAQPEAQVPQTRPHSGTSGPPKMEVVPNMLSPQSSESLGSSLPTDSATGPTAVLDSADDGDDEDAWSDDDSAGYFFTLADEEDLFHLAQQGEVVAEQKSVAHYAELRNKMAAWKEAYLQFPLKIIHPKGKTGFEPVKDFPIVPKTVIAQRYVLEDMLGEAAFSRAVLCTDKKTGQQVCMKIINNNKDFFDQSLDEVKLLTFLNSLCDPDERCLLKIIDYFYYKEHLFIVCELLKDNLYEVYKYNLECGDPNYFTLPRLKNITKQILTSLEFVHSQGIIHCDLKPENILIKSYTKAEVKVIDFGSSCYKTDHLSSYVQSRSYRAPEVMIGMPYDTQVDLWSLGCILAELFTAQVLFLNDSIPTLLARINAIVGPFPDDIAQTARYYHRYYTETGELYEKRADGTCVYIHPKRTHLRHRIHTDDTLFLDLLEQLLQIDPRKRLTASQALRHPWLADVQ